jgi:hypothetical protein
MLLPVGPAGFFMLRTCSGVLAVIGMVTCLSITARAADEILTLACQGTTISDLENAKPEPVSMGIIVNFTNRSAQGFGALGVLDYPIKITAWNDVTVAFLGSHERIGSTTLSHWEAAWGGNCLKTSALCRMETRRRAYASRKS